MPATPPCTPWTAVIPLRGGSKGLPGKNTRLLAGKPLYRHAVDVALAAGASRVLISTDIADVLHADLPAAVKAVQRPAELCGDTVPMAPVLLHTLQTESVSGAVVLLQATSPLRLPSDVQAGLALFQQGIFELVMSVTPADRGVLKWGTLLGGQFQPLSDPAHCFANRQSLPPVVRPNGAVYVFDAKGFLSRGSFVSDHIGAFEMSAERSQDIDNLDDFQRCETFLAAPKDPLPPSPQRP
jgi:CMP-N-acetylneuraminic acid synthetase